MKKYEKKNNKAIEEDKINYIIKNITKFIFSIIITDSLIFSVNYISNWNSKINIYVRI